MTARQLIPAGPCRVCASSKTSMLPIGEYAAFFRLRVNLENDEYLLYSRRELIGRPTSFVVRALRKLSRILSPVANRPAKDFRTFLQYCSDCHAIIPCHEFSYNELSGLYLDYRADTYNRDRISVEPGYAKIAKFVGEHPTELKNRNGATDVFLRRNGKYFPDGPMLDHGGSDGRFIPAFALERCSHIDVFEVSEGPLHSSVDPAKVKKEPSPAQGAYAFVASMHVLEHVGNPIALASEAAKYLKPGGVMYIEVPLEQTPEMARDFESRTIDAALHIHEHINRFGSACIPKLADAIGGLTVIDRTEDVVNFGWSTGLVGRYLLKKVG